MRGKRKGINPSFHVRCGQLSVSRCSRTLVTLEKKFASLSAFCISSGGDANYPPTIASAPRPTAAGLPAKQRQRPALLAIHVAPVASLWAPAEAWPADGLRLTSLWSQIVLSLVRSSVRAGRAARPSSRLCSRRSRHQFATEQAWNGSIVSATSSIHAQTHLRSAAGPYIWARMP